MFTDRNIKIYISVQKTKPYQWINSGTVCMCACVTGHLLEETWITASVNSWTICSVTWYQWTQQQMPQHHSVGFRLEHQCLHHPQPTDTLQPDEAGYLRQHASPDDDPTTTPVVLDNVTHRMFSAASLDSPTSVTCVQCSHLWKQQGTNKESFNSGVLWQMLFACWI